MGLLAHSTGGQISSRLLSCRGADALVELPMASGTLPIGTQASALLIGPMHRGTGAMADGMDAPLAPDVPGRSGVGRESAIAAGTAPAVRWWGRPAIRGTGSAGASAPRPSRIGVLAHHRAATPSPECDAASALRVAQVLQLLGARLQPGSWLAEVREVHSACAADGGGGESADDAHAKRDAAADLRQAARALCKEVPCGVLLVVAAEGLWGADVLRLASAELQPSRDVPGLGSLMRSACLAHTPGLALVGPWGASTYSETIVLRLPSCSEAARACIEAALPCLPHAVAQVGANAPPVVV